MNMNFNNNNNMDINEEEEERKQMQNYNAGKLIEEEADAEADPENDEIEDNEYEEDEGEDDEGDAEEERAMHRRNRFQGKKTKRTIGAIKDEEDKAIAQEIAEEEYSLDSFVDDDIKYEAPKKKKKLVKGGIKTQLPGGEFKLTEEDWQIVLGKSEAPKNTIEPWFIANQSQSNWLKFFNIIFCSPILLLCLSLKNLAFHLASKSMKEEDELPRGKIEEDKEYLEYCEKIKRYAEITQDPEAELLGDYDIIEGLHYMTNGYTAWLKKIDNNLVFLRAWNKYFGKPANPNKSIKELKEEWSLNLGIAEEYHKEVNEANQIAEEDARIEEEEAILNSIDVKINPKNQAIIDQINKNSGRKCLECGKDKQIKGFGIIVYMTSSTYKDNKEEDLNNHIPHDKKIFIEVICEWLSKIGAGKLQIIKGVIGHEHGDENGKCHMQCFVHFDKRCRNPLYPGEFNILVPKEKRIQNYICMAQPEENQWKLENYCKKAKDFITFNTYGKSISMYLSGAKYELKEFKEMSKEDKRNIYSAMIKEGEEFNIKNIQEWAKKSDKLARDLIIYGPEKIINNVNKIIKPEEEIPPHQWHLPQHLIDFIKYYEEKPEEEKGATENNYMENSKYNVFKRIKNWFFRYCVKNNREDLSPGTRKKALFLYGPRGTGKTTLAMSLIDDINNMRGIADSPYIVYCRQNITAKDFKKKEKTAQLLILDDISWVDNKLEMIKALITGGATSIESKFVDDYFWNYNLPCIIITNNPYTLRYFRISEDFKYDTIRLGTHSYLGPDGTQQEKRDENEEYIDEFVQQELDKIEENIKKKKEKREEMKNTGNLFNVINFGFKKNKK